MKTFIKRVLSEASVLPNLILIGNMPLDSALMMILLLSMYCLVPVLTKILPPIVTLSILVPVAAVAVDVQ